MADVGVSISGMPGAPLGPQLRMTTTAPRLDRPAAMAATGRLHSKTSAGPR